MADVDTLLAAARDVRGRAYAPYSRFPVGAAVEGDSGRVFVGANVENAAFPHGLCAEAAAVAALVAAGDHRIRQIAVVGGEDASAPCMPCGGCRQIIAEFAGADTPVHVAAAAGASRTHALGDLLPFAFDGGSLRL
jgi:cytidine deaminase